MGVITNIRTGLKLRNSYLALEAIKRINNWPLYFLDFLSLTTRKYVLYHTLDGLNFLVRAKTADRGIMTAVYLSDEYKIGNLSLQVNSTVIDIGAHIGIFSVSISKTAKKIYSYEAVPENFELLQKNIEINKLQEKVTTFNCAVADKEGELKIFISKFNTGGHSICEQDSNYILISAISLRKVFADNNITKCDLLKIDAEGSEYKILYGLNEEMVNRIDKIFLEFHDIDNENCNHMALREFLIKQGYNVEKKITYLFAERRK